MSGPSSGRESAEPRVFTIAPGLPFLSTFADHLLAGAIVPGFPDHHDRLSLSTATIFLPTRRAARALATLFADRCAKRSQLLPSIVPLGDVDDAELGLRDGDLSGALDGDLPPAIGETERRLILTRLVLAFARALDRGRLRLEADEALLVPSSPADAFALAGDLGRLMDVLATEDIGWESLRGIVEERYDRYFSVTLDFLKIAAEAWPAYLAERGVMDPIRRLNRVLAAEAERLLRDRPNTPMIAAGSTGSIASTGRLLAAISRLPMGAVVLPGLDQSLDADGWDAIGKADEEISPAHGHPQAVLQRLLATIGIAREAVTALGVASAPAQLRTRFLSEALRPAATTDRWALEPGRDEARPFAGALADIAVVEAADEREEALAASLALREALEAPGATAALITPDRGLAERVGAELKRWDIDVDDSAGMSLVRTLPGRLAQLVAASAATNHQPRELLALLAHPLATFGFTRAEAERAAAALEIGLLRGALPPAGLAGLKAILPERRGEARGRHAARPFKRLKPRDWELIAALIARLEETFADLTIAGEDRRDLLVLAAHHRQALVAVARSRDGEDDRPFAGEAGEALASLFDDVAARDRSVSVEGRLADYPAFFAALAGEYRVRPRRARHRRVKIWGLLEARLLHSDHVVVGGLDEGIWPPVVKTDAFLNRPMRAALGLPPPEQRVGQTAHDFVVALGAPRVVITRAAKREGSPTVPSRFLQRMAALAGRSAWQDAVAAGGRYRALALSLDRPRKMRPLARPAPKPPKDLLPRSLSVTEIETLVRDPYSIFAKHVLKLDALEDLAVTPGAANRGTIIHDVFGQFAADHPAELPEDPLGLLLAQGARAFAALAAYPDIAAQWWPRFKRLAGAFVRWEEARRPGVARIHAEISGSLPLSVGDEHFTLRARADRIEEHRDSSFTIVDFKTGTPPTSKVVFAGFAPQLTLEAAMLMRGAFKNVAAARENPALLYVHATGAATPLRPCPVEPPPGDPRTVAAIIEIHLAKLEALMTRYFQGESGFMARPFPQYARRFNEYDHLARTTEWSLAADASEAGDAP